MLIDSIAVDYNYLSAVTRFVFASAHPPLSVKFGLLKDFQLDLLELILLLFFYYQF